MAREFSRVNQLNWKQMSITPEHAFSFVSFLERSESLFFSSSFKQVECSKRNDANAVFTSIGKKITVDKML